MELNFGLNLSEKKVEKCMRSSSNHVLYFTTTYRSMVRRRKKLREIHTQHCTTFQVRERVRGSVLLQLLRNFAEIDFAIL